VTFGAVVANRIEHISDYWAEENWVVRSIASDMGSVAVVLLNERPIRDQSQSADPQNYLTSKVVLVDIRTGRVVNGSAVPSGQLLHGIRGTKKGDSVIGFCSDVIRIYRVPTLEPVLIKELPREFQGCNTCSMSYDGSFVVFGRANLNVLDTTTGIIAKLESMNEAEIYKAAQDLALPEVLPGDRHARLVHIECLTVSYVDFFGESYNCVVATQYGDASIWNVATRRLVARRSLRNDPPAGKVGEDK
jgi:hypothetical protein